MKKSLLSILFATAIFSSASSQTINIVYDLSLGLADAALIEATTVYMHSGSGTTAGWQHIVGNWGADDGVGALTNTSGTIWEIEVNVDEYYGNEAYTTPNSSTPHPIDTAALIIGMVFRDQAGVAAGRGYDNDASGQGDDIFITLSEDKLSYTSDCDCVTAEMIAAHYTSVESIEALSQFDVSPVPFNSSVNFNYSLASANTVGINIYNLQGELVGQILPSAQNAGNHAISFDASDLASGNYFYRLEVGTESTSGSLIKL